MARPGFLRAWRPARPTEDPRAALALIAEFWAWWAEVREDVAASVSAGHTERWARSIGDAVARVHGELEWELAPGTIAAHCLVVSSGGDPRLRTLAERWHRSGPEPDLLWEHRPARPAVPASLWASTLTVEGTDLDLRHIVMGIDPDDERRRVDLQVHHPHLGGLSEESRYRIAALAAQWALGEDGVDRRLGRVEATLLTPDDALAPDEVAVAVSRLQDEWGTEPGREIWARVTGRSLAGAPLAGAVRFGVHRVDYPLFDEHIELRLPYPTGPEGLPIDERVAQDSARWCERLADRLGAAAIMLARIDGEGRTTVHLYGDRLYSVVGQIEALIGSWSAVAPGTRPTLKATADPAWVDVEGLLP